MSTETEILQIIKEQAGTSGVELNDELQDDLGLDSLDQVELVMGLEEFFDIEVPDARAESARTVKDVVELVADIIHGEED